MRIKIQAVKKEKNKGNYPTVNSIVQMVQNGAPASGYQKSFEKISAKQRREERMIKFDIFVKAKMRLEQARFEQRNLELELRMKKRETKHPLVE